MRALILCGSGRRDGFTAAMCSGAERSLERKGWDVSVFFPAEMEISHCDSCGGCFQGGECVKLDAMGEVYAAFSGSDLMVLATPVHFSGESSAIKQAIDRFDWVWHNDDFPHPEHAVGLLCGGAEHPEFSHALGVLRAFSKAARMEWAGELCLGGTDNGKPGDYEEKACAFIDSLNL